MLSAKSCLTVPIKFLLIIVAIVLIEISASTLRFSALSAGSQSILSSWIAKRHVSIKETKYSGSVPDVTEAVVSPSIVFIAATNAAVCLALDLWILTVTSSVSLERCGESFLDGLLVYLPFGPPRCCFCMEDIHGAMGMCALVLLDWTDK